MIIETLLLGAAGSGLWDLSKSAAQQVINYLEAEKPNVVQSVEAALAAGEDARARAELAGVLQVAAANGEISIEGAVIDAIRSASFDHQHGLIKIGRTSIEAPALTTGGGDAATGKTVIGGGTVLRSSGTGIQVGHGASITITGNASIKQN